MDINCTHDCIYQEEGKCNLSFSITLTNTQNNDTDCPYYMNKSEEKTEGPESLT